MPRKRRTETAHGPMPPIVIDTREQAPYDFGPDVQTTVRTLQTGDYSVAGFERYLAIERKSPEDAYATFSRGRERFTRELERMRGMIHACIVVEATIAGLCIPPTHVQRVVPGTVINSLIGWSIDYGVQVWTVDSREIAAKLVLRICERFWRSVTSGTLADRTKGRQGGLGFAADPNERLGGTVYGE